MSYPIIKQIVFTLFFLGAMGLFAKFVWRMVRMARLGQDEAGLFEDIPSRIGKVIYLAFFQRKVVDETFGWNHVIFFWGFMMITIGHIEFLVRGVLPSFSLSFLGEPIYHAILIAGDVMAFLVLFAVSIALFRRIVIKPDHIHYKSKDGFLILGLIASVMITYFLAQGFGLAGGHSDVAGHEGALPISNAVSGFLSGVDVQSAKTLWYEVFWWSHAVVLMTFLNVIPNSKHIHLLGAIPNIFVNKNTKPRASLTKMDFETAEVYGVSQFNQFSWKALLDTYACTECGRCDMYCPARRTGKPLEPQQVIHDMRGNMFANGEAILGERGILELAKAPDDYEAKLPLIAESEEAREKYKQTSPEVLWSCTSCGACVNACPVLIDHVDHIMDMRRHLTMMEGNVSNELTQTFNNIERNYNPWGIGADKRGDWAEALGLKFWGASDDASGFEYLFWVGCAGSFDNRAQKTVTSFSEILDAAGITYAVLGQKERCTGDPLRRTGNEYAFDEVAQHNVTTLNDLGVKKIVTACPHCLNTLKNEYPAFGGDYDVVHHTQMIEQLLDSGRIKLTEEIKSKVTFHDPCFLGRWNDETEAPRKSLAAIKHLNTVEMKEHGKKSFCCGAGGGQMWTEEMEDTKRVNVERTEQALATGADTIAVACPFCMTMIEDGVKSKDKEESVKVLDVAELVAAALDPASKKKPEKAVDEGA